MLVVTAVMMGASIWGVTNLRQEFRPIWFIPPSSYFYDFAMKSESYFPDQGKKDFHLYESYSQTVFS